MLVWRKRGVRVTEGASLRVVVGQRMVGGLRLRVFSGRWLRWGKGFGEQKNEAEKNKFCQYVDFIYLCILQMCTNEGLLFVYLLLYEFVMNDYR